MLRTLEALLEVCHLRGGREEATGSVPKGRHLNRRASTQPGASFRGAAGFAAVVALGRVAGAVSSLHQRFEVLLQRLRPRGTSKTDVFRGRTRPSLAARAHARAARGARRGARSARGPGRRDRLARGKPLRASTGPPLFPHSQRARSQHAISRPWRCTDTEPSAAERPRRQGAHGQRWAGHMQSSRIAPPPLRWPSQLPWRASSWRTV